MQQEFNKMLVDAMPIFKRIMPRFALVKYGGGIIQMSGSIAGTTFARNRYGNYARARTVPINPNTARQIAVRAAIAELSTKWSNILTAAQRAAWQLYADSVAMKNKLGETVFLSGYNHFIRSNAIGQAHAINIINNGPTTFELPAQDATIAVTYTEAAQTFTLTYDDALPWQSEDGAFMHIYTGKPQNAQVNFFKGPFRYVGSLSGDSGAPPASPFTAAVAYPVTEGQNVWIKISFMRADGRLSEYQLANNFCAA